MEPYRFLDQSGTPAVPIKRNFPLRQPERRLYRPYKIELPEYVEARVVGRRKCREAGLGTLAVPEFKNRVAIPIKNIEGSVVGFAGRRLDDLESSDRYVYWPSRFDRTLELYNLDRHAQHCGEYGCDPETLVVVPGFFDVYHLSETVLPLTVATMGYRLSEGQAALLLAMVRKVVVACPETPDGERLARECQDRLEHRIRVSVRMFRPSYIEGAPSGRWLQEFLLS